MTCDQAADFAQRSGSPITLAVSARADSVVLRHEGLPDLAEQATMEATQRLQASGLAAVGHAAAFTTMLCTWAYNTAKKGDRARALELIGDAERIAARLPEHPMPGQLFQISPAQVTLYRVGCEWATGNAAAALQAGRGLRAGQFPTPERRGRLFTDMARAWWQYGRPEQTAAHLLAAHSHAPAELLGRPTIRKIATTLRDNHPRVIGVPALATVFEGSGAVG
jgi:hypothetical protein